MSFIFVFVLGGVFMLSSKNAEAVVDNNPTVLKVRYITSWTPSAGEGINYDLQVFEGTDTSKAPVVFKEGLTTTSFDLTESLLSGKTYNYRVRARNPFGYSGWSALTLVKPIFTTDVAKSTIATTLSAFSGYDVASVKAKFLKFDAVAKAKAVAQVAVSAADTANKALIISAKAVIATDKAFSLSSTVAKKTALKTAYTAYKAKDLKAYTAVEKANIALKALDRAMAVLTGQTSSGTGTVTLNSMANTITIENGLSVFPLISRNCGDPRFCFTSPLIDPISSYLSETAREVLNLELPIGEVKSATDCGCGLNKSCYTCENGTRVCDETKCKGPSTKEKPTS